MSVLSLAMVRTFFLIAVGVLLSLHCSCQRVNLSDSLRHVIRGKRIPVVKMDSRNSFVTGRAARMWGVKVGVSFKKILSVGVGYSWLMTNIEEPLTTTQPPDMARVRMRYFGPFLEYSFYRKGPWEATVPVQLGWGRSFLTHNRDGHDSKFRIGNIVLYEPSMTIEYKILNLIGVGAGIGYRLMLVNNRQIDQQFTSPVYVLRLRLITDTLLPHWQKMRKNL